MFSEKAKLEMVLFVLEPQSRMLLNQSCTRARNTFFSQAISKEHPLPFCQCKNKIML
jgi:hypothetical protein